MSSFAELELKLQQALIKWSFSPESSAEFDIDQVYELFRTVSGPAVTKQVFQSLIDQKLVTRHQWEMDGPEFFEITKNLIDEMHLLNEFMDSPVVQDANKSAPIPASDRTVTLTDNQVNESTKALEDFIQEFRQDHHFGNEWVAEKSALLKTLEAGKEYIQHKVINVRIGAMMTIEPLKEIVAKYEQAAVGGAVSALAQKAIELLMKLMEG